MSILFLSAPTPLTGTGALTMMLPAMSGRGSLNGIVGTGALTMMLPAMSGLGSLDVLVSTVSRRRRPTSWRIIRQGS
jgi:hypothetical protein